MFNTPVQYDLCSMALSAYRSMWPSHSGPLVKGSWTKGITTWSCARVETEAKMSWFESRSMLDAHGIFQLFQNNSNMILTRIVLGILMCQCFSPSSDFQSENRRQTSWGGGLCLPSSSNTREPLASSKERWKLQVTFIVWNTGPCPGNPGNLLNS